MTTLDFPDILKLNTPHVEGLARVAAECGDDDSSHAFARQVRMVEGVIMNTWSIAVSLTRRAESIEEVCAIWAGLSALCDQALAAVRALKDRFPHCGTSALYDLLLDYKLAADQRHTNATEEEEVCRTMPAPKGLFPAMK